MVRASSSEAGGRGFESGPRHTKDVKNGTSGYLAWRSAFRGRSRISKEGGSNVEKRVSFA